MNTARLALIASAVLAALGLVAAAWALAEPGGSGSGGGSGGALAIPVVPSRGGGSEAVPVAPPQQGTPAPPASDVPPPLPPPLPPSPTGPLDTPTDTPPDEELVAPLPEEAQPPSTGGAPSGEGSDSSGGAFSF
jgi:hypothetical protein